MLSNLLIASNSQKTALDIVYLMTQLDGYQTDFALLVWDNFVWYWLFIHYLVFFVCFLCFFVLFYHYRGCDEQKVRFLYQNGAVYLRCSLWPNLFNNLTALLFFMGIFVIDPLMIDPLMIDHVRHLLAKRYSCTGETSLQWLSWLSFAQ